jgi:hypothetical protein
LSFYRNLFLRQRFAALIPGDHGEHGKYCCSRSDCGSNDAALPDFISGEVGRGAPPATARSGRRQEARVSKCESLALSPISNPHKAARLKTSA